MINDGNDLVWASDCKWQANFNLTQTNIFVHVFDDYLIYPQASGGLDLRPSCNYSFLEIHKLESCLNNSTMWWFINF